MNIRNRNAALALAVSAVVLGLTVQPAAAADEPQTGAPVTVTAVKPLLPSETAYVNALHKEFDETKRYPTGREASLTAPEGTAAVWVEIDRSGRIVARGIERTSYSTLLDQEAMTLVGRARYAVLPDDAWNGESVHRFRVAYEFHPAVRESDPRVAVAVQ